MIRVLHVIGAMDRGGAETMIMNFYRKINRNEIHFDFLVHEKRECDYDNEIKELGGQIFSVPRYKIYNYFQYKKEIENFFSKHHDYDIVHGHIHSCINIYLTEAKKYGIRTIAHSHSANYGISLNTLYAKLISLKVIKIADYFFACSRKAGIDRYGLKISKSNKFSVINNGIDTEKFIFNQNKRKEIRKYYNIENKIVFGHVGRFTYAKNHEFLIKIFEKIHIQEKNSVLILVGRGELENKIRSLVHKLNLDDSVIFAGVQNNIGEILNAFDCFIFPSHFEGLGIAMIEAQASDLPCLVTETLPQEVFLSPKVHPLSLSLSPDKWAKEGLDCLSEKRNNNYDLIYKSKFDVQASLIDLVDCYKKIISLNN